MPQKPQVGQIRGRHLNDLAFELVAKKIKGRQIERRGEKLDAALFAVLVQSALLIPVQFEPLEQIAEAFAFVAPFDDIGRSIGFRQDQFFRHKRLKFLHLHRPPRPHTCFFAASKSPS